MIDEEQFDENGVEIDASREDTYNMLNYVYTVVIELACRSDVRTRDMIGGILVSLKSLDLRGRIEVVDPNVDAQKKMKCFWHLHVKIFIQTTAAQPYVYV